MRTKLHKNDKGIAHLLLIVLGVIVIAGVGFVGWKVASNHKPSTNSSGSTTSNNTTTDSSCLALYHDSRICNFAAFSTSFNKTSYTAALNVTQNGTTSTATLKSDGKGNTELTTTGSGETLNAITLDNIEYVQSNGSGPWIEYNTGTTSPTTNPTNSMNIGVGNAGITFKYLDTESCGSLTCYKYKVTDATTPSATQFVWFDNSGYKLRQWQYTDGSGNTTDMTVTYATVNITKPSPVESLSATE
jgi:outer membrane lipoprotein-sorting protein